MRACVGVAERASDPGSKGRCSTLSAVMTKRSARVSRESHTGEKSAYLCDGNSDQEYTMCWIRKSKEEVARVSPVSVWF